MIDEKEEIKSFILNETCQDIINDYVDLIFVSVEKIFNAIETDKSRDT